MNIRGAPWCPPPRARARPHDSSALVASGVGGPSRGGSGRWENASARATTAKRHSVAGASPHASARDAAVAFGDRVQVTVEAIQECKALLAIDRLNRRADEREKEAASASSSSS